MNYNDLTRHHFETAAGAGVLSGPGTCRGAAGSINLGTWVQFDVQLEPSRTSAGTAAGVAKTICGRCVSSLLAAPMSLRRPIGSLSTRWDRRRPALCPRVSRHCASGSLIPIEKLGRLLVIEDAWIAALSSPYGSQAA